MENEVQPAPSAQTGGDDISTPYVFRLLDQVIELCLASGATWLEIIATVRSRRPPWKEWNQRHPDDLEQLDRVLAACLVALLAIATPKDAKDS